jgi:hypothetical protein
LIDLDRTAPARRVDCLPLHRQAPSMAKYYPWIEARSRDTRSDRCHKNFEKRRGPLV